MGGGDPTLILNALRTQVSNSGRMTLGKIREGIQKVDENGGLRGEQLDASQFGEALVLGGLFLKTQDVSSLASCFRSKDDPSKIDVVTFLSELRGEMPAHRRAAVEVAWKNVDPAGAGNVSLSQIMDCFRASEHPRVQTREMTPDEVKMRLEEDLRSLGAQHTCSKETFMEYFAEMSACIPMEKEFLFDALAKSAFCPANPMSVPVERLEQLTRFLCEKFQQISPQEDIYRCVRAKFHHQDQGSTGGLSIEGFSALLQSLGMNLPAHEREAFFHYMAAPCGGGRIELDTFSGMMRKISEAPPMQHPGQELSFTEGLSTSSPTSLVQKIKSHLTKYHPGGLMPLCVAFKQIDKVGRGFVSHRDFVWAMKQCGLRLGTQELENLVRFFDTNRSGEVQYGLFLEAIRGEIPHGRVGLIEDAWLKVSGGQVANSEALRVGYNPSEHPAVLSKKMTIDQKCQEFCDYFGEKMHLGTVTKQAFFEYFVDDGMSISSEADFEYYVKAAF